MDKRYFSIRNATNGDVIAIYGEEKDDVNHLLEVFCHDKPGITRSVREQLIEEIPETEYAVLHEICEIPQIEEIGIYHHLGIVTVLEEKEEISGTAYAIIVDLFDNDVIESFILKREDERDFDEDIE